MGKYLDVKTEVFDGDIIIGGHDYALEKDDVWITVGNISVHIKKEYEGVVCDMFSLKGEMNDPIASTYAFYSEAGEGE